MEIWDILDENGNKTGRTHERGSKIPMAKGEYHLVVHVWVMNAKGEFLISKRTPNKAFPNLWECTGGSAVSGDDSLKTAIKEVGEELGVKLDPKNGKVYRQYKRAADNFLIDVWLFLQEVDISSVVLQEDETCDAMWADKNKISQMIENGKFIGKEYYPYLDELFEHCEGLGPKASVSEKISGFEFVNPVKSLGSYKKEMTLSQLVTFFERQGIYFTKTMIQHYVKIGLLPPLVNKRYYDKRHICVLSIIHILKDIYSLEDIKSVFEPFYRTDFEFAYDAFISMYEEAIESWKADFPEISENLLNGRFGSGGNSEDKESPHEFLTSSLLMAQSAAAKELSYAIFKKL